MNNITTTSDKAIDIIGSNGPQSLEVLATGIEADRVTFGVLAASSFVLGTWASTSLHKSGQKTLGTIAFLVGTGGAVYFAYRAATVKK